MSARPRPLAARTPRAIAAAAIALGACASPPPPPAAPRVAPDRAVAPAAAPSTSILTIVGTSDLHGHMEALPVLGGYVAALRAARGPAAVLLVDAGDMFQGTLESNVNEGAGVVRAYNALAYDAVAIGNHEFDFGPVGPQATARAAGDDPRGALRARAGEAKFPFLAASVEDAATGRAPDWTNVRPSAIVVKDGIRVGLIGVTSEDTPRTTIAANFEGLRVRPLAAAVTEQAAALRAGGASVVVLLAHAGGKCTDLRHPDDASSCERGEEIMRLLGALPRGTVDAVVAGHTHQGMAHHIDGVPVVESFSGGKQFGRIDLTVDRAAAKVVASTLFPPTELHAPATYEGRAIVADEAVARAIAPDVERARAKKEEKLGLHLDTKVTRSFDHESPEGNLFADLMRASHPAADVAIVNGGGLRADLPAGDLTYGQLFEAMPFDNRFAVVRLRGRELRAIAAANLRESKGILSWSGVRVVASCKGRELDVRIERERGRPIGDDDAVVLVTSDFLATGGDGSGIPRSAVTLEEALVRDAFEAQLRGRAGGHLRADEPPTFDRAKPRVKLPADRPVRCGEEAAAPR